MAHINYIDINGFRGIKDLSISDFSKINIVVGDNNSGKTTFLESIQLLFTKLQLAYLRKIINQRTILNRNKSSFYVSFIKMFNSELADDFLNFDIYAKSDVGELRIEVSGKEVIVPGEEALRLSSMPPRERTIYKRTSTDPIDKAKMFEGRIISQIGKKIQEKSFRCTSLDTGFSGVTLEKDVQYISSFGHLQQDLLKNIVDNLEYKKLAIEILRQFDSTIEDVCYTKADDGTMLESIITNAGINMPFSVYGDGIKKILFILNKLYDSTDSILLIDEIETGLHKKYYETLFPVLFTLADKLNVQLFIATHSIEVIDAILKYGHYDANSNIADPIKVITFKKLDQKNNDGSNIVVRNITGQYVYENRKAFNFEVRL